MGCTISLKGRKYSITMSRFKGEQQSLSGVNAVKPKKKHTFILNRRKFVYLYFR